MNQDTIVEQVRRSLERRKVDMGGVFDATFKCRSQDPVDQIHALNDYFRIALSRAQTNTMEERSVLRDDLAPGMWLKYFEQHVLPTVIRFDLLQG